MIIDKKQVLPGAAELRRRAEKQLKIDATIGPSGADTETQRLLQELSIHQVELEMQNAELRQSRDEIEAALASYTDLYDFAPVGYVTLDCFGAICSANLTAATLLGIDRARLLGRSFRFFVTNDFRPLFSEFIDKVFTSPQKETCEVTLTTAGNDLLAVQIEATIAASGQECRAAIIDISRRKALEENLVILHSDLDTRAAELVAANIELEAFNYTVSHDLRRPLTAISGYCQVLQDQCRDQINDESMGHLQEIFGGTVRMNQLINTLLKFSSVTRVALRPEKVNLSTIAEKLALRMKLAEPERRVTFQIASKVLVSGDPDLLQAVLDNLIGNAWKYAGYRQGAMIEFGVTKAAGTTAYFVRDNGPGFDMALAEMLFIPFQRLPGTFVEGHGIGLATVDRIVKRHGGSVWAESKPGKGATFFFTLDPGPAPGKKTGAEARFR